MDTFFDSFLFITFLCGEEGNSVNAFTFHSWVLLVQREFEKIRRHLSIALESIQNCWRFFVFRLQHGIPNGTHHSQCAVQVVYFVSFIFFVRSPTLFFSTPFHRRFSIQIINFIAASGLFSLWYNIYICVCMCVWVMPRTVSVLFHTVW